MRLVVALCMLTVVVSALSPASEEAELREAERALKHAEEKRSEDLPALFLRGEDDLVDVLEDPKQSGREVPVEDLRQTLKDAFGKEKKGKEEHKRKGLLESQEVKDLTEALSEFKEKGKKKKKKGSVEEILEDQDQEKKSGSSQSSLDKQAKAGLASKKDHVGSKHGSTDTAEIVKREQDILKLLEEHIRHDEDMGLYDEDEEREKKERFLLNILKQRLEEEPKNLKLMVSADPEGLYEKEEQFLQMLKDMKEKRGKAKGKDKDDDGSGEEPFIPPALFKDLAKALGKLFSQSFLFFRDETRRESHPRDKREMHPWQLIEEAAGETDNLQEILGEEGLQMSTRDQPGTTSDDDTEALQLAFQIREVLRKKSTNNMDPVEEIEENRNSLANVLSEVLHLARGLPDPSDHDEQLTSQTTKEEEGNNMQIMYKLEEEEEYDGGDQALDLLNGLKQAIQADENLRGLFDQNQMSAELNQLENMETEEEEDDNGMVQFVGHSPEEDDEDVAQDMEVSTLDEEPGDQEEAAAEGTNWSDWFGNSLDVVKKTLSMLGTSDTTAGEIKKRDVSEVLNEETNRDTIVAESLRVYQMYLKDQDETPSKKSEGVCKRTFSPCQRDADCCQGSCKRLVHLQRSLVGTRIWRRKALSSTRKVDIKVPPQAFNTMEATINTCTASSVTAGSEEKYT
ncbi:hypothetical protein Bbelb_068100 [Branchiostoma belcheri]|nr:hypothetical protein Bbelb_068100 [Branchiostoma belcheri]